MISKEEAASSFVYNCTYPWQPIERYPWQPDSYPNTTTTTNITFQGANVYPPELYPEDLDVLKTIMARLPSLAGIDGVFEIEIRIRFDDLGVWAVIGYGDLGEPCLLRFEVDE